MNIDIVRTIGAVTREVANRVREGRPTRVVVASRTYDTDIADLWDALTSAERIPRWFMPITGDLRLGGRYQLQGNAGGEITRCDAPRHLAVTWEMFGETSWVDVRLEERPDGTTHLELEHAAHVDDARWEQYGPGAVGVGWDLSLMGLELYLATGAPNDPKAAEAWLATDDGRDFIGRSSDDWGRASMASGTPPTSATSAAERTTAFYTGA
jgi:uncharacterized protein YndB with AHSA1/START domain